MQANMLFSTARPVAPGIPLFLAPDSPEAENTVDVFARPSNIGAALTGPEILGFQTGGVMWAFFYNDALILDRYGILPVLAYGELRNEDWRFAAGLQFNVFCPTTPNMLTFSMLLGSGNAGNNFPGQFRIERYLYLTEESQLTVQFALSDPAPTGVITQNPILQIITGAPSLRINEDNGWPNVEARIAYSLGEEIQAGIARVRPIEIGVSGVVGQQRAALLAAPNVVADVYGVGVDARLPMSERFGVQGEAFFGQGLGYLNAGVLQNTNAATFEAIRTRGAWGEVYFYLTPCLHTHWGAGIDDPLDVDLAALQIEQNATAFGNIIWDITRQFRVGFETTWRRTDYVLLPDNEGFGFHTQVQWSF
jgi:hypothetical protein